MDIRGRIGAVAAGLLALTASCAAADWTFGPLRMQGPEGFEKVGDERQRTHLRNSAGVDVIVSVFSIPADSEAKRFNGDAERRMKFQEEGAQKVYEGALHGGVRVVPITRDNFPDGSALFSGAIGNSSLLRSSYFLVYLFAAPAQRMALMSVEGQGSDALEQYKRYKALFASASWQPPPDAEQAKAFTERVASLVRAKLGDTPVTVKGPLMLSVGELQANLDRVFSFCDRDAAHCDAEIERYVAAIEEARHTAAQSASPQDVRLVVRTRAYFDASREVLHDKDSMVHPRPLAGDMVILPALDSPNTIRMLLSGKGVKGLDLSEEEIYKVGEQNLRKSLKPMAQVAKAVDKAQIGAIDPDPYNSGRLVLVDSWAPLAQAQGGVLIVAAPANDTLLYISEETPPAIDALRARVRDMMQRSSHPLSTTLLRWNPGGWQVVP